MTASEKNLTNPSLKQYRGYIGKHNEAGGEKAVLLR